LTKKKWFYRNCLIVACLAAILILMTQSLGIEKAAADTSGDGFVTYDSHTQTWSLGTAAVEKKIQLNASGQFLLTSFKNKRTNQEYIQGTQHSDEFQIKTGNTVYSGSTAGWNYDTHSISTLSQGELELQVTFHNSVLLVTRHYVVYPSTGAIREWTDFKNISGNSQYFSSPYMFKQRVMQNDIDNVDLHYMTGGGNFTGSGMLKTVPMTTTYARTFDSYDYPEVTTVDGHYEFGLGSYEQGTAVYDSLFVFRNRSSSEGIWLSFDYNGHWLAEVGNFGAKLNLSGYVSMTDYEVANNQSITSPKTVIGVFQGDLDDMGNTIGEYTYRYLWDYTRNDFTEAGGTWQWRISPQMPSAFESINYNRYVGGHTVHIDANWYNNKGDWQENIDSDDLAKTNDFLQKSGMMLKLWSPLWQADYGSQVVNDHPDWVADGDGVGFYGLHLNLAKPDVYNWILNKANEMQSAWGPYQWRYDGMPAWKVGGSDNDMLMQSQNFFQLLKAFKDANPLAWINGCSSGGETLLMEALRFSDTQQVTDGNAYHYAGYYQSLKLPIDKIDWPASRPEISSDFNTFDPKDPVVKENTRNYYEFNRYLASEGLIGRWVKVFRPTISSGDSTYILQKTNGDQSKSTIQFSSFTPYFNADFTVYPKGLVDDDNYTLRCYMGGCTPQTHTGSYWKTNGVAITNLQPGEVVLFNVTDYPGAGTDDTVPTAPSHVIKKTAYNMDRYGVELTWTAGADNRWISYYEIERNGIVIDKVSKGVYDFVTDGSISDTYKVRTVDGDGNISDYATASFQSGGPSAPGPITVPNIFRASTDFGSSQGLNNWAYFQQYTPYSSSMYLTNMNWDGTNNRWRGNEDYVLIAGNWMSPGETYNAVRKWIAPKDGTILVSGNIALGQSGQGGDGVEVRIKRSGAYPFLESDVWGPYTMDGNDITGLTHQFVLNVKRGEALYFNVNKRGNHYYDVTNWDPKITYGTPYLASAGFSGAQGSNQWLYQEWDGSAYHDMPAYLSDMGVWNGSQTYLRIGAGTQHPDAHDSVRTWVAPTAGTVVLAGTVRMGGTGGDGVIASIKKNGSMIWGPTTIAGTDTVTGASYDFQVSVNEGDKLYFIVNKNGTHYYDATMWDPSVTILP
jgi:hypothetical protein